MSDISTIKDKLTKLLRLSEDAAASPGEIDNALRMASALMARHNLERTDLDLGSSDPTARVSFGLYEQYSWETVLYEFETTLATFACDFVSTVRYYIQRNCHVIKGGFTVRKADRMCFYGPDSDCDTAVQLFDECRRASLAMAHVRYGKKVLTGPGLAYIEGFASGLADANHRMRRELAENSTTGQFIVLAEKNAALLRSASTSWLAETHGIRLVPGRRAKHSRSDHHDHRERGRREGSNYSVGNGPQARPKLTE